MGGRTEMKKLNLDFIGEIVSSPAGMCSWSGTTITFYGKFKGGDYKYKNDKFQRENLIEAVISNNRPAEEYFQCSAFQTIPEKYLYIEELK
jgi:hypothetical protein